MARQTITDDVREWIVAQDDAGIGDEDILATLVRSGWHDDVAREAMDQARRQPLAPSWEPGALPEPDLTTGPSEIVVDGHPVSVLVSLNLPRVVVFGGLLTHGECDALVEQARPRLARSETVDVATGGSEVNAARTSDGMFFGRAETALIERIERRLAKLLRWPVERGEGLQVLRYRPGAEYKPHHDWFDPGRPGSAPVLARGGQRLATIVMYLNAPASGGSTTFPDVGLDVAPVKGNAVFFSYDQPSASTRTLHGGSPVLAGEKWVATKWLRERRFD